MVPGIEKTNVTNDDLTLPGALIGRPVPGIAPGREDHNLRYALC